MAQRRILTAAGAAAFTLCGTLPVIAQPGPSAQDRSFVAQASRAGNAEVLDGRLALQKSSDPAVRRVASRMVADHSAAGAQLASLASNEGIAAPTAPDPSDRAAMAQQHLLRGNAFNAAYLRDQESAHVKAISLFRSEISNGSDPRIRGFARRTLPTLQMHLQMIRAARGR